MKNYLWQLYDEQGMALPDQGAPKQEIVVRGLLHATGHIWLWRYHEQHVEVLVQRRAHVKINWPGLYDKSAGGHVRLHETPLSAALRKADDELGIVLTPEELQLVGVVRWRGVIGDIGLVENELQWLYIAEARSQFQCKPGKEVETVAWETLPALRRKFKRHSRRFVPYDACYYSLILAALADAANRTVLHR